jgi:branched-chain amino acid transport system ATP-binding protein
VKLEVDNVRAGYAAGADVLKGVSLTVNPSCVVGLIGANGAGKSTTLRVICGFLKLRHGGISIGSQTAPLQPDRLVGQGIAYLMEGHSVFSGLSVEENLLLGAWSFRRDRARVRRAIDRAFENSPVLQAKRHVRAGLLSGGQQRILELERLALCDPSLIILDEPSLGLAPKLVNDVFERVKGLKASGATVLIVDQSARHVCAVSDYIYLMRLGKIHTHGAAVEFSSRIEDVVRDFI